MAKKTWFWFIKGQSISIFKNCSFPQMGKIKKNLQKIFRNNHVDNVMKCNMEIGNHLDITENPCRSGENPCRRVISINLLYNFIEIILRHMCTHVNLLHIFRTPFYKNTCGWLLLISHDMLF